jgi:hypothetical protein
MTSPSRSRATIKKPVEQAVTGSLRNAFFTTVRILPLSLFSSTSFAFFSAIPLARLRLRRLNHLLGFSAREDGLKVQSFIEKDRAKNKSNKQGNPDEQGRGAASLAAVSYACPPLRTLSRLSFEQDELLTHLPLLIFLCRCSSLLLPNQPKYADTSAFVVTLAKRSTRPDLSSSKLTATTCVM